MSIKDTLNNHTVIQPEKIINTNILKALQFEGWFVILDVAILITTVLMITTYATVLLFHIVFILLTIGAFYWRFRPFAVRAIFWVTITTIVVGVAILTGATQVDEIIEIPLLTSILVLVYVIAQQRSGAESALRKSEEKFQTLSENLFTESRDAIFITDQENKIIDVNQTMLQLFGFEKEELVGLKYNEEFVDPASRSNLSHLLRKSGFVKDYEVTLTKKDGAELFCLLTTSEWRDNNGTILGYQGIIRNISRRKKEEFEREQLLAIEKEQRILAETLGDVFLALTSQTSYDAVLDEILRQTRRVVSFSAANIMMLRRGNLKIAQHQGYYKFGGHEYMTDLKQSLADFPLDAQIVQTRKPLIVPDTHQEPAWISTNDTAWIRSFVAVPICLHERVLGLLRLDSNTPAAFSAEDLQRLLPLANAAAVALENARLYDKAQQELAQQAFQAEKEIIRLNQRQLALQYASDIIASSSRLKSALNSIPKEMAGLLNVDNCCLFEWDRQKNRISTLARYGFGNQFMERDLFNGSFSVTDDHLIDRCLTERLPQQLTKNYQDNSIGEMSFIKAIKFETLLLVPMEFQKRVVGLVIVMDDETERVFSNREIGLIQLLANQAASVIENNRLYNRLRQENTNRMRVANELRQVAAKNQAILDAISDSIFYLSRTGELLDYKITSRDRHPPEFLKQIGVGRFLKDIVPSDLAERTVDYIQKALATAKMQTFEYEFVRPIGSQYFELRLVVSGQNEVLAIISDISQRKAQEMALEKERARIARDLHDSLGQNLGYLRLKLDQFTIKDSLDSGVIKQEFAQMRDVANEAYELVRNMIAATRLSNSTELSAALFNQAQLIGSRSGFKVNIASEGRAITLKPVIQQQVLYIFQEALNNITKHAQATHADLSVVWAEDMLLVRLIDNGRGFETNQPIEEGHFGLGIMQERAEEIGALLSVTSIINKGTSVILQLPLAIVPEMN